MASHLILRVLLVITSFGHIIEFISALYEKAYVTAIFAISFAIIELVAAITSTIVIATRYATRGNERRGWRAKNVKTISLSFVPDFY